MMSRILNTGRIFYGLAITGIGVLHFIRKGFRQMISAIQPEHPEDISVVVYIFGLYLVISGILIVFGKKLKITSLILANVFILFLVFGHLPKRIMNDPGDLGEWTNALKLLAFTGGAFLVSTITSDDVSNNYISKLSKLAPYGKYFFCIMLIAFGIDHFLYVEFVSGLVPKWIPFPIFWTYFTGIALLGAGISIFIHFKTKVVFLLAAIMLFIWLLTIHLVLAIKYPEWNNGENTTACFQCLAFTGIALLIAGTSEKEINSIPAG
jgi:uncharacterized membrane protein